ncbi:MAG: PKD domain-containing protein [Planctomycetes bacterium]|nr:PKD domain-containing protein [Planctomycetota bacterium]
MDPVTGAISYCIPPPGPACAGVPGMNVATGKAYNPATGSYDRDLQLPVNETDFIVDRTAAVRLGKALFWDMQVGSDGVQSCGTCHFHAGADSRTKNQLNPGTNAGHVTFQVKGPNQTVDGSEFPSHKLANRMIPGEPLLNPANVVSDTSNVMSSMGVIFRQFVDIPTPGSGAFIPGTNPPVLKPDIGNILADPVPAFQGFRRVEPRNTPSLFGAAFNFNNFWDGRARQDFNGGSPFGAADPFPHIYVEGGGGLTATRQLIRLSSMASLATGPALSNFEMSFNGRDWTKIGKKLLQAGVTPLANQLVSPTDSVLGPLSNQNISPGMPGLSVSYADLIEQAFGPQFWSNTTQHLQSAADPTDPFDGVTLTIVSGAANPAATNQFTQKEANFSLFFGLSVQVWTQILVPNDTPFDQFHDANPNEFLGIVNNIGPPGGIPDGFPVHVVGLTPRQLLGYDLFQGSNLSLLNPLGKFAKCDLCHFEPELTTHSISLLQQTLPAPLAPARVGLAVASGVFLEDLLIQPAAGAVEIDTLNATPDVDALPTGSGLIDEGIYNIGVRPSGEDPGRGANDPFGFPLSLAALSLRHSGFPVGVLSTSVPPVTPLPVSLDAFVNPFPLGAAFPLINQSLFLPDAVTPTPLLAVGTASGTFPNPNRVARNGSFKVPQLRNVELTGPYFHNGGQLTVRQVIDFYMRAGDFPVTNAADRDVLILNLNTFPGNGGLAPLFTEAEKDAMVDFILSLTDDRVKFERAPFDHPEIIVPVDGTAPDNTGGRFILLADNRFLSVPAVGAAGNATPLQNFLGISSVQGSPGPDQFDSVPNLRPVANAGPDQAGVVGTSVQFNASASTDPNNDPLTFIWDFGDGSPAAAGVAVGHVYTTAGPFTVTLSASDGLLTGIDTALVTIAPAPPAPTFLMSFKTNTALPGLGVVANEDIVALDRNTNVYSLYFDGSDVGLANAAIGAFCRLPTGEILMSFTANFNVPGLTGGPNGLLVTPSDIVKFTPTSLGATTAGSFSFYFDVSDVGLTTTTESIDAIGRDAAGNLILSLSGLGTVSGLSGIQGPDLIKFTATSLGATTAGTFSIYFDGSDVGLTLSTENIDAVFIGPMGAIYFATSGGFSVPGVIGTNEDIGQFIPTSIGAVTAGSYRLFFDGSANGIPTAAILSGFSILP